MSEEIVAIPLLQPSAGTPELIDTEDSFRQALQECVVGVIANLQSLIEIYRQS